MYKVDNIRSQPLLIQHIDDCHNNGEVEVTAVELVRNNHDSYVVTASNDSSDIQFWLPNKQSDSRNNYQWNFKSKLCNTKSSQVGTYYFSIGEYGFVYLCSMKLKPVVLLFTDYMDIALDEDIGVRCLAMNEKSNKLAVGPNGNNRPQIIDTTM